MQRRATFLVATEARPQLLAAALRHLGLQTVPSGWNVDVLVIGGADDPGRKIAAQHGARYIVCPSSRVTDKLNEGAKHTRASLLLMADDDDLQPSDRLQKAVEAFEAGYDWSSAPGIRFLDLRTGYVAAWEGPSHNGLVGTSVSISAAAFKAVGGYPPCSRGKDAPMAKRLNKHKHAELSLDIVALQHSANLNRRPMPARLEALRVDQFDVTGLGCMTGVVLPTEARFTVTQLRLGVTPAPAKQKLVSVIMAAYRSAPYVREAVHCVLASELPPGWSLELLIGVDGCNATAAALKSLDDERVRVYHFPRNIGTYAVANTLIALSNGEAITRSDSDDVVHHTRLRKMLERLSDPAVMWTNTICARIDVDGKPLISDPRPADGTWLYRRAVLHRLGGYRNWPCAADSDLANRMAQLRMQRSIVEEGLYMRRQHGDQLTQRPSTGVRSELRQRLARTLAEDLAAWRSGQKVVPNIIPRVGVPGTMKTITASLASIPSRQKMLQKVVESLLPQVDRLNVYLNGYKMKPLFLNHAKITTAMSRKHGDLGDAGKFFWSGEVEGYHFVCDDDIVYPADYVSRTIATIDDTGAVVSYHGVKLLGGSYYEPGAREVHHFAKLLDSNSQVHIGGTGVMAYDTSRVKVSLKDFPTPNMADVYMGALCQRQGIPIVCPAHAAGWLVGLKTAKSIYDAKDASVIDTVIAAHEPWTLPGIAVEEPPVSEAPREQLGYSERTYWEARYASGGNSGAGSYGPEGQWKTEQVRYAAVKHAVESILDLGSGDGAMADSLFRALPKVAYRGVDIAPSAVARCKKDAPPNATFEVGDFTDPDFSGEADLVLCLDVLFHLHDQEAHDAATAAILRSFRKVAVVAAWNPSIVKEYKGKFAEHTFYRPFVVPSEYDTLEVIIPHCTSKTLYVITKRQEPVEGEPVDRGAPASTFELLARRLRGRGPVKARR